LLNSFFEEGIKAENAFDWVRVLPEDLLPLAAVNFVDHLDSHVVEAEVSKADCVSGFDAVKGDPS